jgi:RNA polymerase sigma-70 factor (ECF subfamily)
LYAILLHRHQKAVRAAAVRPIALSRLPEDQARRGDDVLSRIPTSADSPDTAARKSEQWRRIRHIVTCLPPNPRRVVLMRFFEGASLPEIGAAMGTSVGTVKSRLHYALEKLRRMNLVELRRDT